MSQGGHGESHPIGGDNVAEAGNERSDGRPAGVPSSAGDRPEGRPETVESATPAGSGGDVETVAPEEKGEAPATEHAPGSDL